MNSAEPVSTGRNFAMRGVFHLRIRLSFCRRFVMRSALVAASSLFALSSFAIAPAASAQVRACEQHNNQTTGTVVGAIGGALLGSAIAGHGHKDDGAIV